MINWVLIVSFSIVFLSIILTFLSNKMQNKIIQDLTDKLMARNYDDYITGQAVKNTTSTSEPEVKPRDDVYEFLVEQAQKQGKRLEELEKEFSEKMKTIVGE